MTDPTVRQNDGCFLPYKYSLKKLLSLQMIMASICLDSKYHEDKDPLQYKVEWKERTE